MRANAKSNVAENCRFSDIVSREKRTLLLCNKKKSPYKNPVLIPTANERTMEYSDIIIMRLLEFLYAFIAPVFTNNC